MAQARYHCMNCQGVSLQEQVPAWFRMNVAAGSDVEKFVDYDGEAKVLAYYCEDCEETVSVYDNDQDRELVGRWQ